MQLVTEENIGVTGQLGEMQEERESGEGCELPICGFVATNP